MGFRLHLLRWCLALVDVLKLQLYFTNAAIDLTLPAVIIIAKIANRSTSCTLVFGSVSVGRGNGGVEFDPHEGGGVS